MNAVVAPVGVDDVVNQLTSGERLQAVLTKCAGLVPPDVGCAAVVALLDGPLVVGASADRAADLARDAGWWRAAATDGRARVPLDFDGLAEEVTRPAREAGFRSAGAVPLTGSPDEVVGCLLLWSRTTIDAGAVHERLEDCRHLARVAITKHREVTTDKLTGLGNRAALAHRLADTTGPVTIAFFDLDDFKPVNDTYGHDAGDHVLTIVAQRMAGAVRNDDLVVRLGGDEFVIVFAAGTAPAAARQAARRIVEIIARPIDVLAVDVTTAVDDPVDERPKDWISISVGAQFGIASGPCGEAVAEADRWLRKDKRKTKGASMTAHSPNGLDDGPNLEVASPVRVGDVLVDGRDNFEVDQRAAGVLTEPLPGGAGTGVQIRAAVRAFRHRAATWLVREAGLDQILVLGTGTEDTLHETVEDACPDTDEPVDPEQPDRVVYVYLADEVPLAYAHRLRTPYIYRPDVRPKRIPEIVAAAASAGNWDLDRPVGIVAEVLTFVDDDDAAAKIIARLAHEVSSGSHVAITQLASDSWDHTEAALEHQKKYLDPPLVTARSHDQVCGFLDDWTIVAPGVVSVDDWLPDARTPGPPDGLPATPIYGAVAKRP